MAANKIEIPPTVTEDFIEHLYEEYDQTTAIAYEQIRLQLLAGQIGQPLVGHYMRSYFGVDGVPEDKPHEYTQGEL